MSLFYGDISVGKGMVILIFMWGQFLFGLSKSKTMTYCRNHMMLDNVS